MHFPCIPWSPYVFTVTFRTSFCATYMCFDTVHLVALTNKQTNKHKCNSFSLIALIPNNSMYWSQVDVRRGFYRCRQSTRTSQGFLRWSHYSGWNLRRLYTVTHNEKRGNTVSQRPKVPQIWPISRLLLASRFTIVIIGMESNVGTVLCNLSITVRNTRKLITRNSEIITNNIDNY